MPLELILLALCLNGLVFCWWMLRCNDKTYDQRNDILQAISHRNHLDFGQGISDTWASRFNQFGEVSYHAHLRALICGRDPYKLYPEEIRDIIKQESSDEHQ